MCDNGCILFLVLHICTLGTLVAPFVVVVCGLFVCVVLLWGPNVPKNTVIPVIFNLVRTFFLALMRKPAYKSYYMLFFDKVKIQ